jgi:hypothetical protein
MYHWFHVLEVSRQLNFITPPQVWENKCCKRRLWDADEMGMEGMREWDPLMRVSEACQVRSCAPNPRSTIVLVPMRISVFRHESCIVTLLYTLETPNCTESYRGPLSVIKYNSFDMQHVHIIICHITFLTHYNSL